MDEIIKQLDAALAAAKTGDLSHLVLVACAKGRVSVSFAGECYALAGMVHAVSRKLSDRNYREMFPSES